METDHRGLQQIYGIGYNVCILGKSFARHKEVKQLPYPRSCSSQPFKCQFHKMAKHTQTIHRQITDELFECVCIFCGIGA